MGMELLQAINTLRAVRRFDQEPLSDEVVKGIVEAATKAPSGGDGQPWEFVAIRERGTKEILGEAFLRGWERSVLSPSYLARVPKEKLWIYEEATRMVRSTAQVPLLIVACIDSRRASRSPKTRYASIYPAVQNLLLAAWDRGIGSCLTVHGCTPERGEGELRRILGLPEWVEVAATIYLGRPERRLGPPKRRPVEEVLHWERW